jgi:hypothetical protein
MWRVLSDKVTAETFVFVLFPKPEELDEYYRLLPYRKKAKLEQARNLFGFCSHPSHHTVCEFCFPDAPTSDSARAPPR